MTRRARIGRHAHGMVAALLLAGCGRIGYDTRGAAGAPTTSVAAAVSYTCAVSGRALWCWGNGDSLQLGNGNQTLAHPSLVRGASDWVAVEGAGTRTGVAGPVTAHTCGLHDDGSLWCWGSGDSGDLGVGSTDSIGAPIQVGQAMWSAFSTGAAHTCGVQKSGSLWCWGKGQNGRLGTGATADSLAPAMVGTDASWTTVTAGDAHSCGIRHPGTLWCWGDGDNGRLGNGAVSGDESTPIQVGTREDWQVVSAGAAHTCAIRADETLWCWGAGANGRLGDGNTADAPAPVRVGTDSDWIDVSAGAAHTCGVRVGGTLWCWGKGANGRLGNGGTADAPAPVEVAPDRQWVSVSAGPAHTCAIDSDGGLWCWGAGRDYALGTGERTDQAAPVEVQF